MKQALSTLCRRKGHQGFRPRFGLHQLDWVSSTGQSTTFAGSGRSSLRQARVPGTINSWGSGGLLFLESGGFRSAFLGERAAPRPGPRFPWHLVHFKTTSHSGLPGHAGDRRGIRPMAAARIRTTAGRITPPHAATSTPAGPAEAQGADPPGGRVPPSYRAFPGTTSADPTSGCCRIFHAIKQPGRTWAGSSLAGLRRPIWRGTAQRDIKPQWALRPPGAASLCSTPS